MRIRLVAVGRVKDPALRGACDDYAARIRRYQRLEVTEVREARRPERDADAARRIEGATLLGAVPSDSRTVALSRHGTAWSSEAMAQAVGRWQAEGRDVTFLIGGAHGLDDDVLRRADLALTLSPFTLPHELARLVLLEQVYRACTILRGEPYHKGRDA
jgi:23S rRNA (pseudouridine1915-N3)-methyltransferase